MYQLRKYHRRTVLTFFAPLLILGYYTFICCAFLVKPPSNGIVDTVYAHARWVYYVWFIVAIFALDWSRIGLANIEAASLMHRHLSPSTAVELMWHTDSKWANPLWWLRAVYASLTTTLKSSTSSKYSLQSTPDLLWVGLSFTTLLVFVALPLSGLTMEISDVNYYTDDPATIYGPNLTGFNWRSVSILQQQARTFWESGRQTTPSHNAILYAPEGTRDASATYFYDLVTNRTDFVEYFAGPAVRTVVHGTAWGMYANTSCRCVPKNQLQMLRVDQFDFAIKGCTVNGTETSCRFGQNHNARNQTADSYLRETSFPTWLNGTGVSGTSLTNTRFSYVAVADGYHGYTTATITPYITNTSHDNATFDHVINGRPLNDTTTGMLEMYLWEYVPDDPLIEAMTNENYSDPVDTVYSASENRTFVGMAVHCDITTAVGYADLNPAHRTYSSFSRLGSWSNLAWNIIQGFTGFQVIQELYVPQIIAMFSLVSNDQTTGNDSTSTFDPLKISPTTDHVWVALHNAVGLAPLRPLSSTLGTTAGFNVYQALQPKDLQLALYKLLGESVIALMDEGGTDPWEGQLHTLKTASYIVSGAISWIYVLVLLSLWALIMSISTLWTALFAGPRWAASLDGFEMFKFGAQYADQINRFESVEFRECNHILQYIPGMVGMLPGTGDGSNNSQRLGFIGLSENVAERGSRYTLDRSQAATSRPS